MVDIVCIVDRSGSMGEIRLDAIGGFNTFIEEQKKVEGEARVTLVLFNHEYILVYKQKPLAEVKPLTEATYVPSGTTALLDAIGRTLEGEVSLGCPDSAFGEKGIVVVLTDGMENASKDYTRGRVKVIIEDYQIKGWEVHYLAANQDAFAEAHRYGIAKAANFAPDGAGVRGAYANFSSSSTDYRTRK